MSALVFSRAVSIFVCSLGIAAALVGDAASQGSPSRPLVSETQFEAWQTELSNWGRWGKDDELGTLNLITPAKRRRDNKARRPEKFEAHQTKARRHHERAGIL